jgi:DNA-binding IclR family transcriptional regulator
MAEISKTVDDALKILDLLGEHGASSPTVIARALKMHRTVVHRALATLHRRGYVRRSEQGYVPGVSLLRVAAKVEPELLAAARPTLEKLAASYGETFLLTIADGDEAVQLEQVVGSRHFVRIELVKGFRHPLIKGASGRAILAFLDPETIAQIIGPRTNRAELELNLTQVRRDGYAISHDELSQNVYGVSAPILSGRTAVASIGVVVPSNRVELLIDLAKVMVKAGAQIGRMLRK